MKSKNYLFSPLITFFLGLSLSVDAKKNELNIIQFQKTAEFSEDVLIIDGNKINDFKCPNKLKRKEFLDLKHNQTVFTFECFNDYLGGIFLKDRKETIAQKDGDAGRSWDTRSMLFINNELKK